MPDRDDRHELRDLRAEIKELKESMHFINSEFEDMKKKLEEAREERDSLKKDNEMLRDKCTENEVVIQELQQRVVHCEQYSRRSNIEIRGLVKEDDEKLPELISKIGSVIGEPIECADMEVCHRVPTRESDKSNVIIQFKSRQKRDAVLEKARKEEIKNSDVGIRGKSRIFLNEHLCPALKRLLALACSRKRDYGWRFVWTRNGKILARKSETSDVVRILCDGDLERIN